MATGRMVRRRMVHGEKIARCTDRARFIWVALLIHADKAGRLNADPNFLKGELFRHLEYSIDQIIEAVGELAQRGLITLYGTTEEPAVLEIVRFADFNKVDSREPDSEFAGPDASDALPWPSHEAYAGLTRTLRVKSMSESESERHLDPEPEEDLSSTSREPSEATSQPVAQARRERIDYQEFIDTWNQNAGELPKVRLLNDKRRRRIQRLVKEHGDDAIDLLRSAARQVATDPYWIQHKYGFDNVVPDQVLEKAEKLQSQRRDARTDPLSQYREQGL